MKPRKTDPGSSRWQLAAGLLLVALLVAGCGSGGSGGSGPEPTALRRLGKPEGRLDLVSLPGHVEPEWTAPFEERTGCRVSDRVVGTSAEVARLMHTGRYDGGSALSGVTGQMVKDGDVAPVNVGLIHYYDSLFTDLKRHLQHVFGGVHYEVPNGRSANLLLWNTREVHPAPRSLAVLFDPRVAGRYAGRISVHDDPLQIADAAVYLMAHRPKLGIEDPYELNPEQFRAAVKLVEEQRPLVGEYWTDAGRQAVALAGGASALGTGPQHQYFALRDAGKPVATIPEGRNYLPAEGTTGWVDSWTIASRAKHPNCMYRWMSWIVSPRTNARVAKSLGESPSQYIACEYMPVLYCTEYRATHPEFWNRVSYWKTPLAECGNGATDCRDYEEWARAWRSASSTPR